MRLIIQEIFNERAKLYRYVDGQWKERGLGQMKILKHKTKNVHRVVMRREQVNVCFLIKLANNEL